MDKKATEEAIRKKYEWLSGAMNERMRRLWAAAEAKALGRGGVTLVAQATGLSRTTISAGIRELDQPADTAEPSRPLYPQRTRRPGGGRHHLRGDAAGCEAERPGPAARTGGGSQPGVNRDRMTIGEEA